MKHLGVKAKPHSICLSPVGELFLPVLGNGDILARIDGSAVEAHFYGVYTRLSVHDLYGEVLVLGIPYTVLGKSITAVIADMIRISYLILLELSLLFTGYQLGLILKPGICQLRLLSALILLGHLAYSVRLGDAYADNRIIMLNYNAVFAVNSVAAYLEFFLKICLSAVINNAYPDIVVECLTAQRHHICVCICSLRAIVERHFFLCSHAVLINVINIYAVETAVEIRLIDDSL